LTCNYWASQEKIRFYFDSTRNTSFASVVTNASGSATVEITIPTLPGGAHDLIGKGSKRAKSTTIEMTIKPSVSLSPKSGTDKTRVTVTFRGYKSREVITLVWYVNDKTFKTIARGIRTASDGTARYTFKVPTGPTGGHKVEGRGDQRSKTSAKFTVTGVGKASIDEPVAPKTPVPAPTRHPTAVIVEPTTTPTEPPTPTWAPTPVPEGSPPA
jgi:hypothetical protein